MRKLPTSVTTFARIIFAIFIAYSIYHEAGVWTGLYAFIIYVAFELNAYVMNMVFGKINDLSDQVNDLKNSLNKIIRHDSQ